MENVLGLLRVRVQRGVNLASRDAGGSDAYVVLRMGDQQDPSLVIYGKIFRLWGTTLGADLLVSSRFLHLNQKLKTSVKKNSLNPEWNEDLTLCVTDPIQPLQLEVYDKDTFTPDDIMGDAELDIQPFMDAVKMDLAGIPNVTIITTVRPSRQNCLADDSHISRKDGTVAQDVVLRLRNVESGEVELQLLWVNISRAQDI